MPLQSTIKNAVMELYVLLKLDNCNKIEQTETNKRLGLNSRIGIISYLIECAAIKVKRKNLFIASKQ